MLQDFACFNAAGYESGDLLFIGVSAHFIICQDSTQGKTLQSSFCTKVRNKKLQCDKVNIVFTVHQFCIDIVVLRPLG